MIEKKREKTDMENNNNNNSGNNFFSGFLLGALVGAAVVFLLRTKKGKRLLKVISEESIDNISNLLDEEPSFAKASTDAKTMVDKPEGQRESFAPKREFISKEKSFEKPKIRRFFRGISRHVN